MPASAEICRCGWFFTIALALTGWLAFSSPAAAQAIVFEAAAVEEEDDAEEDEDQAEGVAVIVVQVQRIGRQQIDQWVFPNGNEQTSRQYLQNQLKMRTDDIDRECRLAKDQLEKLQLAGRIEVKRLFDKIDELRRKYAGKNQNQNNFNQQMWQEVQPLRSELAGGQFGEGSLFDKVVRKTLTPEQLPAYREQMRERREFRRKAQIELLLASIDKQIPLKAAQRAKLREVLQELPAVRQGQYEYYALLYHAAKIPEEKFQAILDEGQVAVLKLRFNQAKGFEQWLRQSGALEAEPDLEDIEPAEKG